MMHITFLDESGDKGDVDVYKSKYCGMQTARSPQNASPVSLQSQSLIAATPSENKIDNIHNMYDTCRLRIKLYLWDVPLLYVCDIIAICL